MVVSPSSSISKFARVMACVLALIAVAVVLATSAVRVGYPFENEWMEGGTLLHVQRILSGDGIYVKPSYAFVAFPYGPVYFYTCAAVSAVIGLGFVPLRLVSLAASVGTVLLVGLFVRRRTARLDAAIIAAGMYAVTYRLSGEWFEIARVDALYLFLFMGAVYLLGTRSSWRSDVLAGVLLALSCLTKQTLAVSWVGRLNVGFLNVLMPAHVALAVLLGLGLGWLLNRDSTSGSRLTAAAVPVVVVLVMVQLVLLRFDPRDCLPTRADREAGNALVSRLANMPGEVVVSAHPYLLLLAGKLAHAHQPAFMTFIGGFGGETDALGRTELAKMSQDIAAKRYSAIILDGAKKRGTTPWFVPLEGHYRVEERVFDDPGVFMPVTGARRQPTFILVPDTASIGGEPPPGR